MDERPDDVVEVEAGWISRPSTKRFFFRADQSDMAVPLSMDGEETRVPPPLDDEDADWRALRLRQILKQRGERHEDGQGSVFRLPWSELLKAMSRVMHEVDEGEHVDRHAATVIERPMADFEGDDSVTLCTPGGVAAAQAAGEETVIQSSPELVAAQQEAAYLEGKLARAEEIRQKLAEQLDQAEQTAEASQRTLQQERARLEREAQAAREQVEQLDAQLRRLRTQLDQTEGVSRDRLAAAERAAAAAISERDALTDERDAALAERDALTDERDAALAERDAAREGVAASQTALTEAETACADAEARYEAARADSAAVRKRFQQTRQDLEERIDAAEEELQRRSAGHERERASLLEDMREAEQMLRELFGRLPEQALRSWVPGLANEPWSAETALRHLASILERLESYRRERRQARLLPVPDFAGMRARLEAGRADASAGSQSRLARLKREIDTAEAQFEALRERHLGPQARLEDLLELNAVVATALGYERELGALGL